MATRKAKAKRSKAGPTAAMAKAGAKLVRGPSLPATPKRTSPKRVEKPAKPGKPEKVLRGGRKGEPEDQTPDDMIDFFGFMVASRRSADAQVAEMSDRLIHDRLLTNITNLEVALENGRDPVTVRKHAADVANWAYFMAHPARLKAQPYQPPEDPEAVATAAVQQTPKVARRVKRSK